MITLIANIIGYGLLFLFIAFFILVITGEYRNIIDPPKKKDK
jgi:hypothetical protein